MTTNRISSIEFKKNLFEGYGKIIFEMNKCMRKNRTIKIHMKDKYMKLLERKRIYEEKLEKL